MLLLSLPCCTQARAILEAAVNVAKEGVKVHPHIMIPLVGIEDELVGQAKIVKDIAEQVRCLFGVLSEWVCVDM